MMRANCARMSFLQIGPTTGLGTLGSRPASYCRRVSSRSVFRFRGACGGVRYSLISLAEFAAEEIDGHAVADPGEFRIVAITFVAKKSVGSIELVPGKVCAGGCEGGIHFRPALTRNVRVLSTPEHE